MSVRDKVDVGRAYLPRTEPDADRSLAHPTYSVTSQCGAVGHGSNDPTDTIRQPLLGISAAHHPLVPTYREMHVQLDGDRGIYWQYMNPQRPCFTAGLLKDMRCAIDHMKEIGATCEARGEPLPFRYVVTASQIPTIFNLGGDLPEFVRFIRGQDLESLRRYAHDCIAVQYPRGSDMDLPIVSISLVQGDALGGGFEAALASDVIIAERGAKFGFPEVLFGLMPGMGAYSFLSRRIGPVKAEQMIVSGRLYDAATLLDIGVVDLVVEDGTGPQAILDFIRSQERRALARQMLYQVRRRVNPVTEAELLDITNLWAETAIRLEECHLRLMERLARAQERRWELIHANPSDRALP